MRPLVTALGLLVGIAALAGCATPTPPAPLEAATFPCTPALTFLEDGRTTRAEAVARLGRASSRWESGRTLIYAVVRDSRGAFHVAWNEPGSVLPRSHDLVLRFDATGRLERHALVPREAP